jgi:hypothetical protein
MLLLSINMCRLCCPVQAKPRAKGVVVLEQSEQLRQVTFSRVPLKGLWISACPLLERVDISGLDALQQLRITDCPELQEVQGLSRLRKLQALELGGCSEQLVSTAGPWVSLRNTCRATVPPYHIPQYCSTKVPLSVEENQRSKCRQNGLQFRGWCCWVLSTPGPHCLDIRPWRTPPTGATYNGCTWPHTGVKVS